GASVHHPASRFERTPVPDPPRKALTVTETTAAVVRSVDAPFTFERVTLSPPREHEVVVEMVAAGLCHTDLSVRSGATPFPLPGVLGHEGAGVVREVGSAVTRVRPG